MTFMKTIENPLEIHYQKLAALVNIAPPVYETNNTTYMVMEYIDGMTLAEKYGTDPEDLPNWVWDQIKFILRTLIEKCNIEYIDISPYNFIEKSGVIWCIDYEHAKPYRGKISNWFLKDLLTKKHLKEWNPDYA